MPNDDSQDLEPKRARVAAAATGAGGHDSPWARQGRAALQGSHSLTEPLARWAPGLVESEMGLSADGVMNFAENMKPRVFSVL